MPRHARPNPAPPDPTFASDFAEAAACHERGLFGDAEARYLALLQRQPEHAGVLHALGLLRAQQGRLDDAIALLRHAVKHGSAAAAAHDDLGAALQAAGRPAEAIACHEAAIARDPGRARSHYNLGAAFHALGRAEAALAPYQKALALEPGRGEAHHNLGDVLLALGRPAEAAASFAKALAINPTVADTHNLLGTALAAQNHIEAALESFRRAVALKPDHVGAHNNLGGLLHALGRVDEACRAFAAAVAANPHDTGLHNNLGVLLAATGRHADAARHFEHALALRSDFADAHNNLGNALQTLGQSEAAIASFERAVALRPDYAEAHSNLGALLQTLVRHAEAIEHFERALAAQPGYAEAHNNLGVSLAALQRLDEAIVQLEAALAHRRDYAQAHYNMGVVLIRLRREREALAQLDRALALKPEYVECHRQRSMALRILGRLDDARQAIETAVRLAPGLASLYPVLAQHKRFAVGDRDLAIMETLALDPGTTPDEQIDLQFGLAKAYRDLDDPERSFQHMLTANQLKRRTIAYDEPAVRAWFGRIAAAFSAELFERSDGLGEPSRLPVFIIGMPRSGSTLVEQILASHRDVFGAGEITAFPDAVQRSSAEIGMAFPDLASAISETQLRRLAAHYLEGLRRDAPVAATRITDKQLSNFVYAGLIHLALPAARMIHIRRNPVDTCLSCFSLHFAEEMSFSYDLGELGRYHRAYQDVMAHWQRVLPPGVMLEVDYEALVDDLEGQARRLVAHCGLDWDPACLAFHRTERPVRTASHAQVRRPLYRSAIAHWRPYARALAPLFEALGLDETGVRIAPR